MVPSSKGCPVLKSSRSSSNTPKYRALYLGVLLLDLELFSTGQPLELGTIAHLLVLAGLSLLVLPIAVRTALPQVSPDALTNRLDS